MSTRGSFNVQASFGGPLGEARSSGSSTAVRPQAAAVATPTTRERASGRTQVTTTARAVPATALTTPDTSKSWATTTTTLTVMATASPASHSRVGRASSRPRPARHVAVTAASLLDPGTAIITGVEPPELPDDIDVCVAWPDPDAGDRRHRRDERRRRARQEAEWRKDRPERARKVRAAERAKRAADYRRS